MTQALIRVEKVSYSFGERTLFSHLSFQVFPGELWAVIGDSGAGKSTLLKILTQELASPTGSVQVSIVPSEVPQGLALCPGLTALETIATGDFQKVNWLQSFFGIPQKSLVKAHSLAEDLKISHVQDQDVDLLSGGERQRVALGRALLQNSKLLIADEPVSALDHDMGEEIIRALRKKMINENGAVICSLHQRHLVHQFATHVLEISSRFEKGWEIRVVDGRGQ